MNKNTWLPILFCVCFHISQGQNFIKFQGGFPFVLDGSIGYNFNLEYIEKFPKSKSVYWGIETYNQWFLSYMSTDVNTIPYDTFGFFGNLHSTNTEEDLRLDAQIGVGILHLKNRIGRYLRPAINLGISLDWQLTHRTTIIFPVLQSYVSMEDRWLPYGHIIFLNIGAKFDLTKQN